jgi:hypothetical protein
MLLLVVRRADDAIEVSFAIGEFKRKFDAIRPFYDADAGYIPMAGVVGVLDALFF